LAHHKLVLEDHTNEQDTLLAIHCSEEPYKLAFMLNRALSIQFKRKPLDLEYSNKGLDVTFPIFDYKHRLNHSVFHLVGNKCFSRSAKIHSSGGLFEEVGSEKTITTYLLPEFKTVDYILKIHDDYENVSIRNLITTISDIEQVISVYKIEGDKIKSRTNLIFD
jgi:hypothetical protein